MIGTTIGHYTIQEKLGEGGMGVVYRAEDTRLRRSVAIKFLPRHIAIDDEIRQRFEVEAQAAAALSHPNIAHIYAIEEHDGTPFIVMEYIEGEELRPSGNADRRSHEAVLPIARQIAAGLRAAHERDIVHRDIKPANIMVTADGTVKLMDFGLAKVRGGSQITRMGSTLGTIAYMSPEQANSVDVDHRCDMWAFGVVLYELLTGRQPFQGDFEQAVIYGILNETPLPVRELNPEVPEWLDALVMRCLAKDREARYENMDAILTALESGGDGEAVSAVEGGPPSPAEIDDGRERRSRSGIRPAWIVMGVSILLLGLGWIGWRWSAGVATTPRSLDADRILILPFTVRGGADLDYLREGMVDLLSARLDGAGTLRSTDPHAVLGYLAQREMATIGLEEAAAIARRFQAGRFILGSIIRLGEQIQITAALHDAGDADADDVRADAVAHDEAELVAAVDAVSQKLVAGRLSAQQRMAVSLAAITTPSLQAMKAFLQGEAHMRRGDWQGAVSAYREAVTADSLFAMAWASLANAAGWDGQYGLAYRAIHRAAAIDKPLPERLRTLIQAGVAFVNNDVPLAQSLYRDILADYPDDVTALTQLGDLIFHRNPWYGRPTAEAERFFERAAQYDRSNAEPLYHLIELSAAAGNLARMDSLVARYSRLSGSGIWIEQFAALARADRDALPAVRSVVDAGEPEIRNRVAYNVIRYVADRRRALEEGYRILTAMDRPTLPDHYRIHARMARAEWALLRGRPSENEAEMVALGAEFEGRRIMDAIHFHTLPHIPENRERLASLRTALANLDTTRHPYVNSWGRPVESNETLVFVTYFEGLLAYRLGDAAGLDAAIARLRNRAEQRGIPSFAHTARQTLIALRYKAGGNLVDALAALDSVSHRRTRQRFLNQADARFWRAEILLALERPEAALRWYRSLHDGESFSPVHLAACLMGEATCLLMLGDAEGARERTDLLRWLWSDCDPALRSVLDVTEGSQTVR